MMSFLLNGRPVDHSGPAGRTLLDYLRLEAGITSVKDGCSGQGFCGACLVEVEGRARLACTTRMGALEGMRVRTLEGFPERVRSELAKAFVAEGAVQCGFCTPGILTRMMLLLEQSPRPSRKEITGSLRGHYCRCTGYVKIVRAVERAAAALASGEPIRLEADARVGGRHPRYGALERALGKAAFTDDIALAGMLHGVLLFSAHPRARVLAVDVSQAESAPGVAAVFTAADIPGERMTGLVVKDWPMMVAVGETTRCLGDVLALVVAATRAEAEAARELVRIDYEPLAPVTDPEEALRSEVHIHPGGNLLAGTVVRRGGPVAELLARSAFVSRGTYSTQRVEHAFLEPEAAVARPRAEGGVELFVQSQGIYEDRRQIAALLALPEERVNVTLLPSGGGFGGKEDLSVQHHAALAAHLLGVAVKVRLTREESIRMHPKRHPMKMSYALGCDERGRLTALEAWIVGDTGAYASVGGKVLERAAGHATGAYHVPAVDIRAQAVYTNNAPAGAMRGFGVNQVTFAVEQCVDELCELGGFDRWQFRWDNALTAGSMTATGQRLDASAGVRACLEAVKPAYDRHPGAGLACGVKNTGIGNGSADESAVLVRFDAEGDATIHHGWTEMGQGVDTVAVQLLCEATGIEPARVSVACSTKLEAPAGMTTASRATSLLGNALLDAAAKINEAIARGGADSLRGRDFRGSWRCDWTTKPGEGGEPLTHFSYGYAAQLVVLDESRRVSHVFAAHDAGRVINPTLFEGQIEGAVVMGLGYALSEELPMEDGRFKSYLLKDLGLPLAAEVPEITVIPVEVRDAVGPFGAKGVGEIGLVPTAAAVAAAWRIATGERVRSLPIAPRRGKR